MLHLQMTSIISVRRTYTDGVRVSYEQMQKYSRKQHLNIVFVKAYCNYVAFTNG